MLQQRLGVTTILVTHDQREAMTMADMVVVMGPDNRVRQVGAPLEIYRQPSNTFVADFIGSSNLLQGSCIGAREVRIGNQHLVVEEMPQGVSPGPPLPFRCDPKIFTFCPVLKKETTACMEPSHLFGMWARTLKFISTATGFRLSVNRHPGNARMSNREIKPARFCRRLPALC